MRIDRVTPLVLAAALLALAPASFAQAPTKEELAAFRESFSARLDALHGNYSREEYLKLKRDLKPILELLDAEHSRYNPTATGFEGAWKIAGSRTVVADAGATPSVEDVTGDVIVERDKSESLSMTGKVETRRGSGWRGDGKVEEGKLRLELKRSVAAEGDGTAVVTRNDDGSLTIQWESTVQVDGRPKARGQARMTRALTWSREELEEQLYLLNTLDRRMRYPRVEPSVYAARSKNVFARFAPRAEFDPNGVEAWVIGLIDGAKKKIDMAVFELQLPRVAEALVRANRERNVAVRIVHDTDDLHERPVIYLRENAREASEGVAPLLVRDDRGRASLMHNKALIIDGETVWTGSTNLTPTAVFEQDNNALLFRSAELAKVYTVEFEEMFSDGQFGVTSPANTRWSNWSRELQPGEVNPREDWLEVDRFTGVQVYFAPEDKAMDRLIELVKGAKKSIQFLAFAYTSEPLFEAMKERMTAGVKVQGVFEALHANWPSTKAVPLHQAGADVRFDANPFKLHHKVIVIDKEIVISGSFNFSDGADGNNDENLIVIKSKPLGAVFVREFEAIFSLTDPNDPRLNAAPAAAAAGANGLAGAVEEAASSED